MSNNHKGLSKLISQVEEQLVQLFLVLSVERSRWLIGQYYSGIVYQRTSHSHSLLFATRQFVGFVSSAIGQSQYFLISYVL